MQRLLALTEAKQRVVGVLVRRHAGARVLVFTADNASAYAIAREHLVMPLTFTNLVLCVAEGRNCGEDALPPLARVVRYRRWVDAAAVLRAMGED